MFRIQVARNGYYFVQEQLGAFHWSRCSRFYLYRDDAVRFVRANKKTCKCKCRCC